MGPVNQKQCIYSILPNIRKVFCACEASLVEGYSTVEPSSSKHAIQFSPREPVCIYFP